MAISGKSREFKNFINGEWVSAKSGKARENRNPANTDEVIGLFPDSEQKT